MIPEEDCGMALTRMHMFLDHELDEAEAQLVALHVEYCEECEEHFDIEVQIRQMIKMRCQQSAPESLLGRIVQLHCEPNDLNWEAE